MTKRGKLRERFLSGPRDFTWQELVTLLSGFGYELAAGGKTAGSRVRFTHPERPGVTLHRPHGSGVLKRYQVDQVREFLIEEGLL